MRILLYGINFSPELTGIGKYTGEMAGWLSARGYQVRMVTAPPYYPNWRVADGYSAWRYDKRRIENVIVLRCPAWVPQEPTGLKRLIHLASFAISSAVVMWRQLTWRPNVVLVVEPPLFCAPTALAVAWLSGAKSWLHVQDFEVDAAFELGLLRSSSLRVLVACVERYIMRRFHRVSTISDRMLESLKRKGVSPANCVLFSNWVDTQQINPTAGTSPFREELGIADDAIVALYSGNMGEKQGLEVLVDAAHILQQEPHIRFVIAGSGAARQRLEVKAAGLSNIQWLPVQPLDRLNALLNLADIHLLPQRANAADLVMPSKLTGMFASGRPVVAAAPPGTQVASVMNGCGLVVPPEDAVQFAHAIARLAKDTNMRRQMGASARAYAVEHWGKDAVLDNFEAALKQLQ